MKKSYTRKQIKEAIRHWQKLLESADDAFWSPDAEVTVEDVFEQPGESPDEWKERVLSAKNRNGVSVQDMIYDTVEGDVTVTASGWNVGPEDEITKDVPGGAVIDVDTTLDDFRTDVVYGDDPVTENEFADIFSRWFDDYVSRMAREFDYEGWRDRRSQSFRH